MTRPIGARGMKNRLKRVLAPAMGYALAALAALTVLFVIALLGGSVMRMIGFRYRSVGGVFLFFLLATLLSLPLSLLARGLPNALLRLERLSGLQAAALYLVLDTLATAAGMFLADRCMESVSASNRAVLAVSFLLALASVKGIREK